MSKEKEFRGQIHSLGRKCSCPQTPCVCTSSQMNYLYDIKTTP